ncbi:MAG: hypothetical protein M1308_10605 [Actinobacteria bacterium]|nr:hypothetical protein [Actinomycetota bacterium]
MADEHCIKVNPLIIDRKNKYQEQWNLILASASATQVEDSVNKYFQASNAFIKEEQGWLANQKRYLNSKAFNLLMPSYIKEAANFQYQMYEADYNSSVYLNQGFKETDKNKQAELGNKVLEETVKSKEAEDKYNAVWEREKGKSDWVHYFIKVPQTKCPKENFDFPNVFNPFVTPIPVNNDETKG